MPDSIDALMIRRWCAAGLDRLRLHQHEIDDLNVYPVPDGDTGTNLVLTMTAAAQALAVGAAADRGIATAIGPDSPAHGGRTELGAALHRLASGALLGARGNSGVILAQILRGLADALATVPAADGRALAAALGCASVAARAAVAEPTEGTMLTVAAAASAAATAAAASADSGVADASGVASADSGVAVAGQTARPSAVSAVASAAAQAAREALARTPEQLPVLARAGVVDAGGRGLVLLLDALAEVVTGDPAAAPTAPARPAPAAALPAPDHGVGPQRYGYEVQYLLDAAEPAVRQLKAVLAGLGDSLVVVGAGGPPDATTTWNVHVHADDVGAVIEAGIRAGRPHRISVSRFADRPAATGAPGPRTGDRAVVVVCHGGGLSALFAAEGATTVTGGSPSIAEILQGIRATGAADVAVLPNDRGMATVASAAAAAAREVGVNAGVVPTRSPVQGLAAIAVRDMSRRFEDDVIAMAEAAGACRYAEVTIAAREALTVAGRCKPGDVLALVEGEVNLIGLRLLDTCRDLLDRLLSGGGELVTLVLGADAPPGLGALLTGHLERAWPFVEVRCYEGGQPIYPLLVGVE